MEQQETKFIVEIRKDYIRTAQGEFIGGEWESLKDEFGCEQIFEYYFEAYRMLKTKCPAVQMFGQNVGRVKEVVMIDKRNPNKNELG